MTHLSTVVEIAADLRRRAEQIEPAFSTMQIVEACFPNTLVTGRALRDPADELVTRQSDGRHVIVYNRALTPPEQRYAICHALGHIIFDGASSCCGNDVERERRCDQFADELLVPLDELAPYVSCVPVDADCEERDLYLDMVDLIASHFGVLASVVDRRIRQLSKL
jgi:Zn-dependent peptidase ImmA (M78 family)